MESRYRARFWSRVAILESVAFITLVTLMFAAPFLPTARAATWDVTIVDNAFQPALLEIAVGDTVRWTNTGNLLHSATADDDSWTSGTISLDGTYSRTFDTQGIYPYHCTFHTSMRATLNVGIVIPEFSSAFLVVSGMAALMIGALVATGRRRQ